MNWNSLKKIKSLINWLVYPVGKREVSYVHMYPHSLNTVTTFLICNVTSGLHIQSMV